MEVPTDIADLPNEVAFKIWAQVIIANKYTYDDALLLAKTYRSLNKFLRTDYEYPTVWRHFWNFSYGEDSNLHWDEWLAINEETGAAWATSWRSFFFWCLLIERASTRILLESIVDQAYARYDIEFHEPSLFSDINGWQGPVALLTHEIQRPILPQRWKYQEAHINGDTIYTFVWPDGSEQLYRVEELMDVPIQPIDDGYEPTPPIYVLLWVYHTFNNVDTVEPFEGMYPGIPNLASIFEAFVREAFRWSNDVYFERISDRDVFPLNPMGDLPQLKALVIQRPDPVGPIDAPRYYGEDQIYIGCASCNDSCAALKDPSIGMIFCNVNCQRQFYQSLPPNRSS